MHEGATYNANMHMGGPHDITSFIKLHATGNCGFQLLCEQQHMTVDDELFTWYHDLASGQLVGVLYEPHCSSHFAQQQYVQVVLTVAIGFFK